MTREIVDVEKNFTARHTTPDLQIPVSQPLSKDDLGHPCFLIVSILITERLWLLATAKSSWTSSSANDERREPFGPHSIHGERIADMPLICFDSLLVLFH